MLKESRFGPEVLIGVAGPQEARGREGKGREQGGRRRRESKETIGREPLGKITTNEQSSSGSGSTRPPLGL